MSAAYAVRAEPPKSAKVQRLIDNIKATNIAEQLDDVRLAALGAKVCEEYEIDKATRTSEGWDERNEAAMKLALQAKEEKNFPWAGAANIKYPLLTTAAIQFNARAYPAIVDGANVVKGKVLGEPNDAKQERADRIARHMSWQLLEEMDGWEEDTDRLLVMLPIVGCVFRKTWYDPICGYNASKLIPPDKLVVNYWARDIESCPRVTQEIDYYPHEIEERRRSGLWLDIELGQPQDAANDELAPHKFLEQHRLYDLDEDGYPEPYIVTVHRDLQKVVRIVARYDEDGVKINARGQVQSIEGVRYFTKYSFIPSPDGSFYDIGFGHLLGAINETINTTLNQLMDAGTLANLQGGFIGAGVTVRKGEGGRKEFRPGEWKSVEVTGGTLRENIVPLPIDGPSEVLFNLFGMLVEAAKDMTATKDILTGETQGQNQPVGTTLATIEQGLKVFTAIYKRVHRALKKELALLYRLNRLYLTQQQYFQFQDTPTAVAQKDYASSDVDVIPVSDPNVVTDMQRISRAQFRMQFVPLPFMNGPEIVKSALEAAGDTETKRFFSDSQAPDPKMLQVMAQKDKDENAHKVRMRELDIEERKLALQEAAAKATNTNLYATATATLASAGQTDTVTSDNPVPAPSQGDGEGVAPDMGGTTTTQTVNKGIPSHAHDALAGVHALAVGEIDAAIAAEDMGGEDMNATDQAGSGDVQPMAGQSPDASLPDVSGGQAAPVGGPVGDGSVDGPADPSQGIPAGAVGPDQMG